MAIAQFEPLLGEYDGFDKEAVPNYLMVPHQGMKYLHLRTMGTEVAGVESTNPAVVSVKRTDELPRKYPQARRVYEFTGKAKGQAQVVVRGPRRDVLARLDVGVKALNSPSVQFFFVRDAKGRRTSTAANDVEEMLAGGNKILVPQVNVKFALKAVREITVNRDLGDPIRFAFREIPFIKRETEEEENWHAITDFGDLSREVFNVFCLWSFVNRGSHEQFDAYCMSKTPITASEMARSGANVNMCVMKGSVHFKKEDLGRLFAHEAGHYLTKFPSHYHAKDGDKEVNQDKLMRDANPGLRLTKGDVEAMNP
jgi:hypothetical protein